MTAVTENDVKRLEDLILGLANGQKAIENRLTAIDSSLEGIKSDITALAIGQAEIKGEIKAVDSRITGLKERTDDLNGPINIITVGFLGIFGVLVTALVSIVGKIVFFSGNP
jgi:peptidoglycan hydrolase CwlO-like protein